MITPQLLYEKVRHITALALVFCFMLPHAPHQVPSGEEKKSMEYSRLRQDSQIYTSLRQSYQVSPVRTTNPPSKHFRRW